MAKKKEAFLLSELEEQTVVEPVQEEVELKKEVSAVELQADAIIIRNDKDFADAGQAAKDIKAAQKKVTAYWEPMRAQTYSAYTTVMDHKKEMLGPLERAEKILKQKMTTYQKEQRRRQQEEEALLRRLAQQEMEKKLAEAEEAEMKGDVFGAEYAMAEAQVMDTMASTVAVTKPRTKVSGITQTTAWEIKSVDLSKLPCEFAGVVIRPADLKAIMQLIKDSKGKVQIPGVEYEETVNISVRAS